MRAVKRHLLVGASVAACGLKHPRKWTHKASEVTCARCRATVEMADAEIEEQTKPRHLR